MLPWIATTVVLIIVSGFAPEGMADTLRLFAIGYGGLTVFIVAPTWAVIRLAHLLSRRQPAPVRVLA
jgi:hypothetical protein